MGRSNKGSRYERDICTMLSVWWSGGKRDDIFWRSSISGARATTRAKKGKSTSGHDGDVCAIHPSGEPLCDLFSIEIKRGYPKETIYDLVDRPDSAKQKKFEEWIQQAMQAHENSGSYSWILIVKRDQRRAICFMPCHVLHMLQHHVMNNFDLKERLRIYTELRRTSKKGRKKAITSYEKCWIAGIRLSDFLQLPQQFIRELARSI